MLDGCVLGCCVLHLVGVGWLIMDSSMLVATMTGLPLLRQPCTPGGTVQYSSCAPGAGSGIKRR